MVGERKEWEIEALPRECTLKDYQGAQARWCPGCGDHAVLNAVQRLARDKQLETEKTMVVAGIGCSSRFPFYMSTYGFHGLHGRAFPVAEGIKSRRPDLHMFVVTGDGDCCAIGAGHWVHALRYNMDLTVLLLDNNIYGLTKSQTSPTTKLGQKSNTHPGGSPLPPLNPLTVALGVTNVSFVAQAIDWNPPLLYNIIKTAYEHKGTSFIRILQRCPHFTSHVYLPVQEDMSQALLMTHDKGVPVEANISKLFPNQTVHDPTDLVEAQRIAARDDVYPVGLLYRNEKASRYDEFTSQGLGKSQADKLSAMNHILDRFAV